MTAQTWAAIAASFSAVSAFLVMRIQRRNLIETLRPQIVLEDWTRGIRRVGTHDFDQLVFGTVSNVGRGVALNVYINASRVVDGDEAGMMGSLMVQVLGSGQRREHLNNPITLPWQHVPAAPNRHIGFKITIYCWDTWGTRYVTTYQVVVFREARDYQGGSAILPGVMLTAPQTTARAVWILKVLGTLRRAQHRIADVPFLGRPFRKRERH